MSVKMSGHIPFAWQEEMRSRINSRHCYLRIAKQSMQCNRISDVHTFCQLAEREQIRIDEFAQWYDIEQLKPQHQPTTTRKKNRNGISHRTII